MVNNKTIIRLANCSKILPTAALITIFGIGPGLCAGPYTEPGIYKEDESIVAWAADCNVIRGFVYIKDPNQGYASFGSESDALGEAEGTLYDVVSLGDGGSATLTFDESIYITNGGGNDFAIFENGFSIAGGYFLELAFVEVSSNGTDFFGFEAIALTPTNRQVVQTEGMGALDPTNIHNLAGKYERGYGTPFDLEELKDVNDLLDVNSVTHIRIIDVVGFVEPADFYGDGIVNSIDYSIFAAAYMSADGDGNWNRDCDIHRDGKIDIKDLQEFVTKWLDENDYSSCDINGHQINDPWPTPFDSGGFDLDAVGVINKRERE